MKAKTMTMMAVLGGMGVAGYMYMKKNPIAMHRMKKMVKGAAKRTYEKIMGLIKTEEFITLRVGQNSLPLDAAKNCKDKANSKFILLTPY